MPVGAAGGHDHRIRDRRLVIKPDGDDLFGLGIVELGQDGVERACGLFGRGFLAARLAGLLCPGGIRQQLGRNLRQRLARGGLGGGLSRGLSRRGLAGGRFRGLAGGGFGALGR
jgi:hypothetical protein